MKIQKMITVFLAAMILTGCGTSGTLSAGDIREKRSEVICRVELDRSVLPANGPQTAIVKVTLDAPDSPEKSERPPVNLSIVLDRSGSMSGQKLEKAKEAAIEALRRLGPRDLFSLVIYDHNVETIVPAQSAKYMEAIEGRIRQIYSGGNTALFGGVSQGAAEVRKNMGSQYVHRIILLSDGLANVGPSTPEDLGRLGAALIKEGISVTTVGVGTDYNEDLMTRLSQNSDGNTYFVESSVDLPRIFAKELGDVLSVVAKKVNVIIECPAGVRPVSIIGRDGRIMGQKVEVSMNQLYGGQEKYALVKVEIPPGEAGKELKVADAAVTYDNIFKKKRETATGNVSARFSRDKAVVAKSVNVKVNEEIILNTTAIAQDQAIELSDEGKREEAAEVLRDSAGQMIEFGKKYDNTAIIEKGEEMKRKADEIESQGMDKRSRKELRTDSYQMKQQQSK